MGWDGNKRKLDGDGGPAGNARPLRTGWWTLIGQDVVEPSSSQSQGKDLYVRRLHPSGSMDRD